MRLVPGLKFPRNLAAPQPTRRLTSFALLVAMTLFVIPAAKSTGAASADLRIGVDPQNERHPVRVLLESKPDFEVERVFDHPDRAKRHVLFVVHGRFGFATTEAAAQSFIEDHFDLFDLRGTESLRFAGFSSNTYTFAEYIGDYEVSGAGVQLLVDKDRQIVGITSTTLRDPGNLPTGPQRSIEEVELAALDAVRAASELAFPDVQRLESRVYRNRKLGFLWKSTVVVKHPDGAVLPYNAEIDDLSLKATAVREWHD